MARSKNNQRQRDFSTQSLTTLLSYSIRPAPVLIPVPINSSPRERLSYGLDRRAFNPTRSIVRPAAVRAENSRVVAGRQLHATRFADPRFVGICIRRKIRKEVLFAKKHTRKGSRGRKKFNFWSKVSCK